MRIIIRILQNFPFIQLVLCLAFRCTCQSAQFAAQSRQSSFCLNHEVGDFVANPLDCQEFYWCGENGDSVPASCPPRMLFNSATKLCDAPHNVNCELATTPTSETEISSTQDASQVCLNLKNQRPDSNALVFIGHPKNCSQYYMCYHGQALLQECSANLLWNSNTGKCDLPSKVKCLAPSTPDTPDSLQISPTVDESTAVDSNDEDYICPLYGQHIFPHLERCDFFIYCVKGYGILQKCPFFQWFDVESGRCRWRTNALCIKDLNLKFRKKEIK